MLFRTSNHPKPDISSNQDAFCRSKSSLPGISIKSGCIPPLEFIPPRHFHQIRMHFSAGIHPSKTFPPNQDEYRRRKACCPQKASGSLAPRKLMSQFPPISPGLSFHQKTHTSASTRNPQPQLLPASSASISALTASTIPESSRMRSLSMRLMGTDMENAYRDPPSSESAAAMQRTPASFSSLSSA